MVESATNNSCISLNDSNNIDFSEIEKNAFFWRVGGGVTKIAKMLFNVAAISYAII